MTVFHDYTQLIRISQRRDEVLPRLETELDLPAWRKIWNAEAERETPEPEHRA